MNHVAPHRVPCLLLLLVLLPCLVPAALAVQPVTSPAGSGPRLTGVWEGQVLVSRVVVEFVQETELFNNAAYPFSGVVNLHNPSGPPVVYHVNGYVNPQGMVAGVHPPSATEFKGALWSADELRGTITLKSGQQIPITALRKK